MAQVECTLLGTGKEEDPYRPDTDLASWKFISMDKDAGTIIIEECEGFGQ